MECPSGWAQGGYRVCGAYTRMAFLLEYMNAIARVRCLDGASARIFGLNRAGRIPPSPLPPSSNPPPYGHNASPGPPHRRRREAAFCRGVEPVQTRRRCTVYTHKAKHSSMSSRPWVNECNQAQCVALTRLTCNQGLKFAKLSRSAAVSGNHTSQSGPDTFSRETYRHSFLVTTMTKLGLSQARLAGTVRRRKHLEISTPPPTKRPLVCTLYVPPSAYFIVVFLYIWLGDSEKVLATDPSPQSWMGETESSREEGHFSRSPDHSSLGRRRVGCRFF